MLFRKHMPSAIYKMKLHPFGILHSDRHRTFICFCRTFGIRNIYDFILCTMHDAHPAGVVLNFCKGIHLHDIHCIATPQFHQSAAESIGNILRIKFYHHHFSGSGVIRDTQCRIKQDKFFYRKVVLCCHQSRHKTALTASHQ